MSHVDYKKSSCHPVEFKKSPCRPVEFKKGPCRPVEFKKTPCCMSLKPKMGHVALSILGVNTPNIRLDHLWTFDCLPWQQSNHDNQFQSSIQYCLHCVLLYNIASIVYHCTMVHNGGLGFCIFGIFNVFLLAKNTSDNMNSYHVFKDLILIF